MIIEQVFAELSWRTQLRRRPDSRSPGARGEPAPARGRVRVRVLVIDEKGIMRDGLCALLAVMPDLEIVGSVAIGADTVRTVTSLRPAVIVIEFPPTPLTGLKLIATLKAESPGTHIVVLSFHGEDHLIEGAVRAGADGYVLKTDSRDDLFEAVLSAAAGKRFMSPSVRGRVVRGSARAADAARAVAPATIDLTERERQVIRLIAAGRRTREMAQALSLSHKTIEKHRTTLMRKLGLRNASAVAAYAIAHGLADE
ncbi:MAG TPA: response regulator transcription factor [Steroidobacteraceae bacterium]|jgi:DNA-binding NarL/FixJ family response regulator